CRLAAAEQRTWEMTDASDRNAARLAASLAQLERHKEQLDETFEELEATRKLLAAAQARALEQERLLASERAKLARAGIESDGPSAAAAVSVDDLFADLDMSSVDLQPPPFAEGKEDARPSNGEAEVEYGIPSPVSDAGSTTTGSGIIDVRPGPRLVVEALESD